MLSIDTAIELATSDKSRLVEKLRLEEMQGRRDNFVTNKQKVQMLIKSEIEDLDTLLVSAKDDLDRLCKTNIRFIMIAFMYEHVRHKYPKSLMELEGRIDFRNI